MAELTASRAAGFEEETKLKAPAKTPPRDAAKALAPTSAVREDRRVRKTKKQIREAFTSLLLEKRFEIITVREISELADVNRGTFYTHFRDTQDLLDQLENRVLDELKSITVTVKRQDWERATYRYLEQVLTLCSDYSDVYTALILRGRDPSFEERFVMVLRHQYLRGFLRRVCRTDENVQELYCVYIVDGLLAIVSVWLKSGMKEAPGELARIAGDFIMRGVKGLR